MLKAKHHDSYISIEASISIMNQFGWFKSPQIHGFSSMTY